MAYGQSRHESSLYQKLCSLSWKKSKNPQISEKEYEDILNGFIEADKINNELDKQYMKKFQKILSNKKIYKVLKAEIKFQRNMLKIVQQDNPQK